MIPLRYSSTVYDYQNLFRYDQRRILEDGYPDTDITLVVYEELLKINENLMEEINQLKNELFALQLTPSTSLLDETSQQLEKMASDIETLKKDLKILTEL